MNGHSSDIIDLSLDSELDLNDKELNHTGIVTLPRNDNATVYQDNLMQHNTLANNGLHDQVQQPETKERATVALHCFECGRCEAIDV